MRTYRGFTLIELLISLAILGLLATLVFPLSEISVKRERERILRRSLMEIRDALDAYKRATEEGRISKRADESGYPRSLDVLVEGVPDARSTTGERLYFLRRVPRDPFTLNAEVPATDTWGLRSFRSPPDAPREGDDIYDVYSLAPGRGLNGIPYRGW